MFNGFSPKTRTNPFGRTDYVVMAVENGEEVDGDFFGSLAEAHGFAAHISSGEDPHAARIYSLPWGIGDKRRLLIAEIPVKRASKSNRTRLEKNP